MIALFIGLSFTWNAQAQTFNDVQSLHINKTAVDYLKSNQVIQGYSDGTYKPENRINRAEFVKILIGSQIQNPTGTYCFSDVRDEWYASYICTAKRLGYVKGYPDGTFRPSAYINFAEASKIIATALKVQTDTTGTQGEWFAGYVNGMAKKNAIPTSVQFFDKDITRGEMAEMIWRLKANKTDKPSQDYVSITQEFPALQSCAALQEKFTAYQGYQYGYRGRKNDLMIMEEMDMAAGAVPAPTMMKSMAAESVRGEGEGEGEAASDFSSTNIQVEGVDEADIIKNDGQYIYLIKGNTVRIINAFPPKTLKEVGKLDYTDENFSPTEMYVNGDQLVVIGRAWGEAERGVLKTMIMPPRPWHGDRTKVVILDIKDHANPKIFRTVRLEGNYSTSRRINNSMYLILNAYPDVWIMNEVKTGEDLVPEIQDGDNAPEPLVKCADIHYFPGFIRPNYLIAVSIPLDEAEGAIDREVFLGSSDNVYSSRTHLYVATNDVQYDHYTDWDWNRDRTNTLVYKFALENGEINFLNRGRVPGTILNQFSMDANVDHFRIATTLGNTWDSVNPSTSNVYVLDKEMKTVGKIEQIAPGERIYSTRFMGDRLYMVTFRQVDPLFVIDLSDPVKPKILGKLKIPGFSDYLHPYDKNHIIGFGKDTEENKYGNVVIKGFKMALFDVTDVVNPVQQYMEAIGDQGTYSELLTNHKALLFDKEKELLAFPINIVEKVMPEALECTKYRYASCPALCQQRCIPSSCKEDADGRSVCTEDCEGLGSCTKPEYESYQTTFAGAVVYTLNEKEGFVLRGKVSHYNEEDLLKMGDYWPYNYEKNIQRIIYIGDYLYSISQGKVKASTMDKVEDVGEMKVD